MHILILTPTQNAAEALMAILGDTADRCTFATTWPNALSCLEEDRPDLVVIQRAALTRLEPTTVLNLIEPGRWPPLIIADIPSTAIRDGALLTRRLVRAAPTSYQIGELHIDTRKK